MTGPEHYRKAAELAKLAARHPDSSDAGVLAQLATAHATLALAAATALSDAGEEAGMPLPDYDEWVGAASKWKKGGAEDPAPRCAECGQPVNYRSATYCSTACRNRADRHDVPEASGE